MMQGMFAALEARMVEAERETVITKGAEYTHGSLDRLASFKETAAFAGIKPTQVCLVYMTKHFQSLANFVNKGVAPSGEPIDGRIMDLRVYLVLMMALLAEERDPDMDELSFMGKKV